MRFRSTILLFCLSFALLPMVRSSATNVALRVNESATRVSLRETSAEVALAVENPNQQPVRVRIELEWLDPQNRVTNRTGRVENIAPGANSLKIPFPLYSHFRDGDRPWFRLKYRVTSDEIPGKDFAPITGIISLSEMASEMFDVQIIASDLSVPGKTYLARVRAMHPVTGRPVAGVRMTGKLEFDNATKDEFVANGLTDRNGFAALSFKLPKELKPKSTSLSVIGKLGEYSQKTQFELRDWQLRNPRIILTTDKPLYQPGQTLHIRALAMNSGKRAIPDAELELEIEDPESQTQFRANLKTSRFGIACVDWKIPDSTRLGDYNIKVSIDDEDHGEAGMSQSVKITRYELPNFAVKTKADRGYYLPGQNAEVEVRADYLFGQPVNKGKVRVIRETGRQWNYKLQKWETEEEASYEGETDATGKFFAKIDLAEAHADLAEENNKRFQDLSYAAYFTDQTTGRTEQKRFDLRVTREPIHVYFIGSDYYQANGLPAQFYLSASYADGTPAVCEITVSERTENEEAIDKNEEFTERRLRTVKTNRFGIAKVSDLALPARAEDNDKLLLGLTAADSKGAIGHYAEMLRFSDETFVRLRMNKAIYLKGEPIEVQLIANQPNAVAVLSVIKEFEILHSQLVRMRNGKAFVVLPYQAEFNDLLSISAIPEGSGNGRQNSRSIIYPRDRELNLGISFDRAEYRPGDDARVRLRALTGEGVPVESALGVTVIDRGVEERVRTNGDFGGAIGQHNFVKNYLRESNIVAGVSVRDLRKLDVSQPISAELQLAAEVLLLNGGYQPRVETSGDFNSNQQYVFQELIQQTLRPLRAALNRHYERTNEYPRDRESLDRILNIAELGGDKLRDPWGNNFRAEFSSSRERDYLSLQCAGADKKFGTADDFSTFVDGWAYFKPLGDEIQRTARRLAERDGHISLDVIAFKAELKRDGLDFDSLRDRRGNPYSLELTARNATLQIAVASHNPVNNYDWFTAWSGVVSYFQPMIPRINTALEKQFNANGSFPANDESLYATLKAGGINLDSLKDWWGNPYYGSYLSRVLRASRINITFSELQKNPQAAQTPKYEKINFIELRSKGADGVVNTPDDFTVAEFTRLRLEQDGASAPTAAAPNSPQGFGAIKGIVTDHNGAVIAGATIVATGFPANKEYKTRSGQDGDYLIRNLPEGKYRLMAFSQGFRTLVVEDVPIYSATLTEVSVLLEVGAVSEVVMVSSSVAELQTEASAVDASLGNVLANQQIISLPLNNRNPANLLKLQAGAQKGDVATPRLREHFQETLVWQPQLETDKQGRAQLKFKLADNITTWKMSVIGSTIDGQIGFAEKEFTAFQPFFAELDPPRVLTEGDEISLPVVLRNYLNKAQTVTTEMKPESWFALVGPARQRSVINAADAAKAIFDFRVLASVKDGKQRVTAIGADASDAIEKPVTVHPDGEEIAHSHSQLFGDRAAFDLNFPADTIKNSARAELKIYPNLRAHVLESIEAIMQRPYGCGEQTISSTYPSLLALRLYKLVGGEDAPGAEKAKRYLQSGYDRLLGYRHDGGFGYWSHDKANVSLTAYALKFLSDAAEFIAVDENVINSAREWLTKQQYSDGSWSKYNWEGDNVQSRAMATAYVSKTLAMLESRAKQKASPELKRALAFLAGQIDETKEGYVAAAAALAAIDGGETVIAEKVIARLNQLAREEAGTTYWGLESNSPFYSWGLAGQIETTAIAAQAMMRMDNAKTSPLIGRSVLFLLKNKDRFGVWHSTQATVNALDALLAAETINGLPATGEHRAEVLVNGKAVTSIVIPAGDKLAAPLTVDLSGFVSFVSFVSGGEQKIEIRRPANSAVATAQLVTSFYRPWSTAQTGATNSVRLSVKYDRNELKIGDVVTCQVEAARVGGAGQGMMLAEIGLPPGAEVDRASLEKAVSENGYAINQYDVLPDRVIAYLWPRAGGTKFEFKFKLRYGIKAQGAPSVLYDYYNPEAKAVIAPTRFVVR
ncbi:MAG: MG2 domain-containing protein [Blastocatellia bacterium]